jgi:hypothetical protein
MAFTHLKQEPIKGKAIPVIGHGGQQDYEISKLPHFLDMRLIDDSEALCTGHPLPTGGFLVLLISVRS